MQPTVVLIPKVVFLGTQKPACLRLGAKEWKPSQLGFCYRVTYCLLRVRSFPFQLVRGIHSGLIGEENNSLIAYLTYTSRKRHTPLHLMCLGASGTGKTWLQEKVSELMPEEDKLEITSLSSNAFYYFGREELKHKLLLIEDLDGTIFSARPKSGR